MSSSALQLPYMCQHHHGKVKRHSVVKFADVQPQCFFETLQPVDERIAVQVELSGGFGDIQVVFVKFLNRILGFFVQAVREVRAKYFM